MPTTLTLANFAILPIPPNGLVFPLPDDCDEIVIDPGVPGQLSADAVGISLQTKRKMWFKGIEAHGAGEDAKIEAENGARSGQLTLSLAQLTNTTFVFVKAKLLGVHTPVYQLAGSELGRFAGRSITFDWRNDHCG